jgi:hypothetical protein
MYAFAGQLTSSLRSQIEVADRDGPGESFHDAI